MSLWHAEVEKSKINPSTPRKRKFGDQLNKLFAPASFDKPQYQIAPRYQAPVKSVEYDRIGVNLYPDSVKPRYSETPTRRQYEGSRDDVLLAQNLNRLNQELSEDNVRLRQQVQMSSQPYSQNNIDQIAQLIIQRSQMEQDMKSREEQYKALLNESQDLTKQMRIERDGALIALKNTNSSQGRSRSVSGATNSTNTHTHRSHHVSPSPPMPPPAQVPVFVPLPAESQPRPSNNNVRYSEDELLEIFQLHDDLFFRDQFHKLEASIKKFVLNAMKSQPDAIQSNDLSSPMDTYIFANNLDVETIFGIRDVRCIVCRGFLIEFLLEKVFRVFLFGISNDSAFKEAFHAISAIDLGQGSKWAASIAKSLIRSSTDYRPEKAAERLMKEIKVHLGPFIDFTEVSGMDRFVMVAIEVARDCRLAYSSFSLELPQHLATFDPMKMESSVYEEGEVAVSYSPIVMIRGNKYGEDYQFQQVVVKGKVWRESIFSELSNLMGGYRDTRERYT